MDAVDRKYRAEQMARESMMETPEFRHTVKQAERALIQADSILKNALREDNISRSGDVRELSGTMLPNPKSRGGAGSSSPGGGSNARHSGVSSPKNKKR